jgi:hypothetical protein
VIRAVNLLVFDSMKVDTENKVSIALASFSFGEGEVIQRGGSNEG